MAKEKNPTQKATGVNGDARANGAATASKPKTPTSALQTSSKADNGAAKANVPSPAPATVTSVHPSVSPEQIRRRAYDLYTQRGRVHGRAAEDWFRAEAELLSRR